jgi:hypothetical protein
MSQPTLITLIAGTKAKASEVMANLLALAQKFGAIDNTDIAPGAGITGDKISASDGSNLTNANFGRNSVDSRVLKSDPLGGSVNAAVNTIYHIKAGLITSDRMALNSLLYGVFKLTTHTFTFGSGATMHAAGYAIDYNVFTPNLPLTTVGLPLVCYLTQAGGVLPKFQPTFAVNSTNNTVAVSLRGGESDTNISGLTVVAVFLAKV